MSAQGKFKEREVSERVDSRRETDVASVGAQPSGDESSKAFIARQCSTWTTIHSWCVDSGASNHMTVSNDEGVFRDYERLPRPVTISVADGKNIEAVDIGTIAVPVVLGGEISELLLHKAWYVPALQQSLISVHALAEHGYELSFMGENVIITKDNSPIAIAIFVNGMYQLVTDESGCHFRNSRSANAFSSFVDITLWHQHLGHANPPVDAMGQKQFCRGVKHIKNLFRGNQQTEPLVLGLGYIVMSVDQLGCHHLEVASIS